MDKIMMLGSWLAHLVLIRLVKKPVRYIPSNQLSLQNSYLYIMKPAARTTGFAISELPLHLRKQTVVHKIKQLIRNKTGFNLLSQNED